MKLRAEIGQLPARSVRRGLSLRGALCCYRAYNLKSVKSRARPQDPVSEYQATHSPPDAEAPADPRDVPYPVTLVRDETDGAEWVATVDVLPGCNARGSTPDEALERVAAAVAEWVEAAGREGKEIPEPKSAQSHSGRLLLRMPQTLHAELAGRRSASGSA